MDAYQRCLKAMEELFAKDCIFSLAEGAGQCSFGPGGRSVF